MFQVIWSTKIDSNETEKQLPMQLLWTFVGADVVVGISINVGMTECEDEGKQVGELVKRLTESLYCAIMIFVSDIVLEQSAESALPIASWVVGQK